MKRPRILLLSGWYPPDTLGGTEAYVESLAEELVAIGFEVAIGAPHNGDGERRYEHRGVSVYRWPAGRFDTRAKARGDLPPEHLDAFAAWLRSQSPDLVHIHSLTSALNWHHLTAIRALGLPVVMTIHMPTVHCPKGTLRLFEQRSCDGHMRPLRCAACVLHVRGYGRPLAWAGAWASRVLPAPYDTYRWIDRRRQRVLDMLQTVDRVIVVSRWLQQACLRNGIAAEQLVWIRHGLAHDLLGALLQVPDPKPARPLRIGFIGRLEPGKGALVLAEAMRHVPRELAVEVQIAGPAIDAAERRYEERIRALTVEDPRIRLVGLVPPERRADWFRGIDLLAVPSLWLESGPLVVLEAFAAGRPVLGSDGGGVAEWVEHGKNGVLVPIGDRRRWGAAISALAGKPEQLASMLPDRQVVRTGRSVARETLAVYRAVMAERGVQW